jgi:hypothetical protein
MSKRLAGELKAEGESLLTFMEPDAVTYDIQVTRA